MSKKKNTPKTPAADLPALKIGSRVRCTDDGVEGRIVWANGVAVKIEWTDGEKVTWRRDALAGRPIEILDAADEAEQPVAPAILADAEPAAATQLPPVKEEPTTRPQATALDPTVAESTVATPEPANAQSQSSVPEPTAEQTASDTTDEATPAPAKPRRTRKAAATPKEKKVSALDAAAKVLAEEGRPMTCQEMIEVMAAKGYWTSPGGKTPAATLYSAILREITTKGTHSRFVKADRGTFALADSAV
jgi:HB1, ASXL, restriction endonuclease HTH domain